MFHARSFVSQEATQKTQLAASFAPLENTQTQIGLQNAQNANLDHMAQVKKVLNVNHVLRKRFPILAGFQFATSVPMHAITSTMAHPNALCAPQEISTHYTRQTRVRLA
jgi:hypothetical protein